MNRSQAQSVHYKWDKVDTWIKNNPEVTFTEFKKEFPQFPFSDATYYGRRRRIIGKPYGSGTTRGKTLYETLAKIELAELKDVKPLDAMKKLLEVLNKSSRTGVDIIELANPPAIEIRSFQK